MKTKSTSALRKVRKSVRSKSGKTFQRSYMVRTQTPKKGTKGRVLASFNHPGPNSGSDHSWLALAAGALKDRSKSGSPNRYGDFLGAEHAFYRRDSGAGAVATVFGRNFDKHGGVESSHLHSHDRSGQEYHRRAEVQNRARELARAFNSRDEDVSHRPRRGSFE